MNEKEIDDAALSEPKHACRCAIRIAPCYLLNAIVTAVSFNKSLPQSVQDSDHLPRLLRLVLRALLFWDFVDALAITGEPPSVCFAALAFTGISTSAVDFCWGPSLGLGLA